MDVWKLRNAMVQSESGSDGWWIFRDGTGNVINIQGGVEIIRVNDASIWDKYFEYHAEFNTKSYQELHPSIK